MLTFPPEAFLCPMEGDDTVPSNPFCSSSPHNELQPSLPSLSSVTLSCDEDGKRTNRRRGRIHRVQEQTPRKQQNKDRMGLKKQEPTRNMSPTKRERDSGMVQVSQSLAVKLLRPDTTQREQKQKSGLDIDVLSWCPTKQDQKCTVDQLTCYSENEDIPRSTGQDWDTSHVAMYKDRELISGKASGSSPPTKGWVIGPLFQSLKSKMATFTEIVMSPVRLFKPNSPPPSSNQLDFLSKWKRDGSNLEAEEMVDLQGHMLNVNCNEGKKAVSDSKDGCNPCADFSSKQQVQKLISHTVQPKLPKGKGRRRAIHNCSLTKQLDSSFDFLTNMPAMKEEECALTKELSDNNSVATNILLHNNFKENSESSESFLTSSSLVVQPSDQPSVSSRSNLSAKMEEQVVSSTIQLGPSLSKYVCSRQTKKKRSAKMLSDASLNLSTGSQHKNTCLQNVASKCNKEHLDKIHDLETRINKGDFIDETHVSLSSSICYTQPDNLFLSDNGTSLGGISVRKSTRKASRNVTIKEFLIKTHGLDNQCFQQQECDQKQEPVVAAVLSGSEGKRKLKFDSLSDVVTELAKTKRVKMTEVAPDEIPTGSENVKLKDANSNSNAKSLKVTLNHTSTLIPISKSRKGQTRQQKSLSVQATSNVEPTDTMITPSPDESRVFCENHLGGIKDTNNINDLCKKRQKKSSQSELHKEVARDINSEYALGTSLTKKSTNNQLSVVLKHSDASGCLPQRTCETKPKMVCQKRLSNYLDMQPALKLFKDHEKTVHLTCQPFPECSVHLNNHKVKSLISAPKTGSGIKTPVLVRKDVLSAIETSKPGLKEVGVEAEGTVLSENVLALGQGAEQLRLRKKPRKADFQRWKGCGSTKKRIAAEKETNTLIGQELDLAVAGDCSAGAISSGCLLRSYSCPEIPSLHHDSPWNPSLRSPQHVKVLASNRHQSLHLAPSAHKLSKRARRHTVCSVEVEREIAPLCLRKEVYPSRRPCLYGNNSDYFSPGVPLSPSTSLSALASHFLSSPLAFLSQKLERKGIAASNNVSGHFASCSSPSVFIPSSSSSSGGHPFAGPIQKPDTSLVSSLCSVLSKMPLENERDRMQQSEEDGEDTSCSSHEFDYMGLREEKALSDSEIKMECSKHEERGKVSAIRICKTLPKPVNNLTPMGLPKPMRLKKKEFSLAEIYTNKNFTKPSEGRLETIFEVPLSRQNGSQSLIGKKRMKRFVEFPEVGVVRKPRKRLIGVGKAGITSSFGRPKRGGYPSSKDDSSYNLQELDSLLCSKLEQLDSLIAFDQGFL